MYIRSILGSNWNNSVNCGSRSSNWNNSPLNLNSNNSGRSVTDTEIESNRFVAGPYGPLADILTLLRSAKAWTAKHTATAPAGLVLNWNVRQWGLT